MNILVREYDIKYRIRYSFSIRQFPEKKSHSILKITTQQITNVAYSLLARHNIDSFSKMGMVWQGTIGRTAFQRSNGDVIGRWMEKGRKVLRRGWAVNTVLSRTFRGTVMRDIDRHYRRLNEARGPRLNHRI